MDIAHDTWCTTYDGHLWCLASSPQLGYRPELCTHTVPRSARRSWAGACPKIGSTCPTAPHPGGAEPIWDPWVRDYSGPPRDARRHTVLAVVVAITRAADGIDAQRVRCTTSPAAASGRALAGSSRPLPQGHFPRTSHERPRVHGVLDGRPQQERDTTLHINHSSRRRGLIHNVIQVSDAQAVRHGR